MLLLPYFLMTEEYVLLVKKKLNGRKISLRENESASLGTPDTRADSLLFFGREEGHPTV